MGQIYLNGEAYGGGGGAQELTSAQYNALSQAEKMNGTIYFVTDYVENADLARRMTSNTSTDGTVSANGSYSSAFEPWHALASETTFDASVNGEYWAGNGDGAYLQFNFSEPVNITAIGFASYQYANFNVMYSTDGTSYSLAQNIEFTDQSTLTPTRVNVNLTNAIENCVSIRMVCDGGAYNLGALHFYGYKGSSSNKIYFMGKEYGGGVS